MNIVSKLRDPVEQLWLKRWYVAPRVKITRLDLKLDLSMAGDQVRAEADFSFKPQVAERTMVCGLGGATVHSAIWKGGGGLKARVNGNFLVMKFAEKLDPLKETTVRLKYTYTPDQFGSIRQPLAPNEFSQRNFLTCRRPLLALSQGELVRGEESPPLRTYEWKPQRSRRLNAVVADVRSFKKEAGDGMRMWLHVHADSKDLSPQILDLLIEIYTESTAAHHRPLGYTDFHVVESDERHLPAFNSAGLIVVPRGSFRGVDKPTIYGLVAPEFNKEWGKTALRMRATGEKD